MLPAQCPEGTPPPCRPARDPTITPKPTSVAVLNLRILSQDTVDAYLAEGLADAIASRLGRGGRIVVTSRMYIRRLRGVDTLPAIQLARALNAAYLVSGTMLRSGERLRITVELMHASSGRQTWSDAYDRRADDVLLIEAEVAAAITQRLVGSQANFLAAPPERPTNSPAAYDLYLRGRFLFNKLSRESLAHSLDYYHRAIALDSSFALAYVALAESYWWLVDDWMSPREVYPRMRAAVDRALAIDSDLARAHALLGSIYLWYNWDRNAAAHQFTRALSLDPADAEVHHEYAFYLGEGTPAGVAELETAQRLDPLNLLIMAELAEFLVSSRPNESILIAQRVLAMDSAQSLAWHYLGDAYLTMQRPRDALAAYERCRVERWARCSAGVVNSYLAMARVDEARAIVAEMERRAGQEYLSPIVLAWALVAIGQNDKALAWLDRAVDDRSGWLYGELDLDPAFQHLHGDPRYQRIKLRMQPLRDPASN